MKAPPTTTRPQIGAVPDVEYEALNRAATRIKNEGDWAAAIALLREAKAQKGALYQDTRLAKFLQQAGFLDEALQEIQWLLDNSRAWAQAMFSHQPASVLLRQKAHWMSRIHGDAALICKRAKRPDLQEKHESQRDAYWELVKKADPVAIADKAAQRKAWESAKRAGPNAMQTYLSDAAVRIAANQSNGK